MNYFAFFWQKEEFTNNNFTCITADNYPMFAYANGKNFETINFYVILANYYGDSDDPLTNNEIKYCWFGASVFLLAIGSAFLRFR